MAALMAEAQFLPVAFAAIEADVKRHLAALPSVIDSFVEDHIVASTHYRIAVAGEAAGFASVHSEKMITQFALAEPFRRLGQPLFAQAKRLGSVQDALVPTCDEFFLAHALDEFRLLHKQAYFFAALDAAVPAAEGFSLRPAVADDVGTIRAGSGDFFGEIERRVAAGEILVTERAGNPVGFGLAERSALYPDVASVGMFTVERFRREGIGTATIALLIAECRRRGVRPVAGCWAYNHASKRTLERAGMYAGTRLLRIDY